MSTETKPQTNIDHSAEGVVVYRVVRRIESMTPEEIQAAIDASHPVEQIADMSNLATQGCLDADALAMRLIHDRHGKREIVDLLRWVLMGAPNAAGQATPAKKPQASKP